MPSKRKEFASDELAQTAELPRKRRRLSDDEEDELSDDEASDNESFAASDDGDEPQPTIALADFDDDDGLSRLAQRRPRPAETRIVAAAKPVTGFGPLGVSAPLVDALSAMAIRTPTAVQASCIPPLLAGKDCIGNAKTGSGKTMAFALPILQKLYVDPYGIFALVLTPTRELAFQIADQFSVLGGSLGIRTAVVVGGMDMMQQAIDLCNRPHVVIATPGRLVDHLNSSSEWDLKRVRFLVLDEADRLLQPTFANELKVLMDAVPKDRQTCLFTATLTPAIESLAAATPRPGKEKPFVHRMPEGVETVETLKQLYLLVPSQVREAYLYYLLCNPPESIIHLRRAAPEPKKKGGHAVSKPPKPKSKTKSASAPDEPLPQPPPTIIFAARARTAAYLTVLLQQLGIRTTSLHSRLTQRERLTNLGLFKSYVVPVLVTTDVGARGLDIEDVALVVNWDMPQEPEEYTHRVGRTARAGRGGLALSFVTERDEEKVLKIEDRIKIKLQEYTMSEDKVLDDLNTVFAAKRLANMELHDSDFGKREEVHKAKQQKVTKAAKKAA
ncbi:DEAD-domain-containing protein [Auriculariales sp. MPI-PUGE-AT-0066]|nr:DEAD-domain-containing protein [Auriculariales sp. MPI-PUGE-AT-0066]